jgi:hypothetical protein
MSLTSFAQYYFGLRIGKIPRAGDLCLGYSEYVAHLRWVRGGILPACVDSAQWDWTGLWYSGCYSMCGCCFNCHSCVPVGAEKTV